MSFINYSQTFITRFVVAALFLSFGFILSAAEPELIVAAVHPNSRSLLEQSGGTMPEHLTKTYRILFLHNTGEEKGDDPLRNGYLVLREPVLHQADFEKFFKASTMESGIDQIHITLKTDALKYLESIKKLTPVHNLALVVDNGWIFLIAGTQVRNGDAKLMTFSTLSKIDQHRAMLFHDGKRAKDNMFLKIHPEPGDYPTAKPVPGKEGFFKSPYTGKTLDGQYMPSGVIMNDPDFPEVDGKFFFQP